MLLYLREIVVGDEAGRHDGFRIADALQWVWEDQGDNDEKNLVVVLLAGCLAACAQPPAPQQAGAPPPAPAAPPPEAAPPPAPRATSEAQISPGRWDVDRLPNRAEGGAGRPRIRQIIRGACTANAWCPGLRRKAVGPWRARLDASSSQPGGPRDAMGRVTRKWQLRRWM